MGEVRLIDANALKAAIKDIVDQEIIEDRTWAIGLRHSISIIDSAPTVEGEITEKQAILFLINNGWLVNHDKELREKWARPQGVWIKHWEKGFVECPFCGHEITGIPQDLNYCCKCGAKLLNGGAE